MTRIILLICHAFAIATAVRLEADVRDGRDALQSVPQKVSASAADDCYTIFAGTTIVAQDYFSKEGDVGRTEADNKLTQHRNRVSEERSRGSGGGHDGTRKVLDQYLQLEISGQKELERYQRNSDKLQACEQNSHHSIAYQPHVHQPNVSAPPFSGFDQNAAAEFEDFDPYANSPRAGRSMSRFQSKQDVVLFRTERVRNLEHSDTKQSFHVVSTSIQKAINTDLVSELICAGKAHFREQYSNRLRTQAFVLAADSGITNRFSALYPEFLRAFARMISREVLLEYLKHDYEARYRLILKDVETEHPIVQRPNAAARGYAAASPSQYGYWNGAHSTYASPNPSASRGMWNFLGGTSTSFTASGRRYAVESPQQTYVKAIETRQNEFLSAAQADVEDMRGRLLGPHYDIFERFLDEVFSDQN